MNLLFRSQIKQQVKHSLLLLFMFVITIFTASANGLPPITSFSPAQNPAGILITISGAFLNNPSWLIQ